MGSQPRAFLGFLGVPRSSSGGNQLRHSEEPEEPEEPEALRGTPRAGRLRGAAVPGVHAAARGRSVKWNI
jgi:hypothetical protein